MPPTIDSFLYKLVLHAYTSCKNLKQKQTILSIVIAKEHFYPVFLQQEAM